MSTNISRSKYQSNFNKSEWKDDSPPVEAIKDLLDVMPNVIITIGLVEWRRTPRDEQLFEEIMDIICGSNVKKVIAEQIYNLFEERNTSS